MLFFKACKEVLEGVLLFVGQQYRLVSGGSGGQTQPRLSLTVSTEETTGPVSWSVRVDASDLGIYYLDEKAFIEKFYTSCGALRSELDGPGEEIREFSLFSRRIGEYSTVQNHNATFSSGTISIRETALPRPSDFPPYGLRICFQLSQCSVEDMKREASRISYHMQLIHLTNSHVEMEVEAKAGSEVVISHQFPREPTWQPTLSSPFRLTLSTHHFTVFLSLHKAYSLGDLALRNGSQLSLRIYCSAAIAPHLSLPRGRKIPANRVCQHLRVYVFGPGGLPVSSAGCLTPLSLSSLADWETFGLSLTPHQDLHNSSKGFNGVVSCGYCQLSNSQQPPDSARAQNRSGVSRDLTLLLFVFLEETSNAAATVGVGGGSSTTCHWSQQMDLVCELKEMMETLLQSHQKKFKQATHSVLNKLLCNYGTHMKTASIMRTALPQLAEAVASIIRQSSNSQFKQKCKDTLKIEDQQKSQKECIADRLWEIAEKKLHVSKTQTKPPQEPSSPELEQAASEDKESSAMPSHTTEAQRPSSEISPDVPPTEPSSTSAQPHRGDIQSPRTTTSSGPRRFSLFGPSICSKRTKRDTSPQPSTSTITKPSESTETGGSVEVSSFEALAELEVSPEQQAPPPDDDLPHSASDSTTATALSEAGGNSPPEGEGEDLFFEELATAEIEDCTFVETQDQNTVEKFLSDDEDISTEMMEWEGEQIDDGELLENGFSDFPSSESCSEFDDEIAEQEGREENSAEQPLNRSLEINSKLCLSITGTTTTTTTDSDWEMLGELSDDPDTHHHPHCSLAVKTAVECEAPTDPLSTPHTATATVPDISHEHSFNADIDEEDFHWD